MSTTFLFLFKPESCQSWPVVEFRQPAVSNQVGIHNCNVYHCFLLSWELRQDTSIKEQLRPDIKNLSCPQNGAETFLTNNSFLVMSCFELQGKIKQWWNLWVRQSCPTWQLVNVGKLVNLKRPLFRPWIP